MIPPLNPLHVFDVAARHLRFTRAAAELRVTQPAISRQIKTLEGFLGVRLFERDRQGLRLTSEGEEFQRQIAPAFRIITNATASLTATGKAEPLKLRVYTTFAAKWLIQRLPSFYVAYPQHQAEHQQRGGTDRLRKGQGRSRGPVRRRHMARGRDRTAVQGRDPAGVQPEAIQDARLVDLDDLRKVQLLHSHYRRADWPDWLMAVKRPDLLTDAGVSFPSSVLTYQAAVEGVGVAVGQLFLLRNEIHAGTLVPLFNAPFERPMAHYVAWPKHRPLGKKSRSFIHWIKAQVAEFLAT